MDTVKPRRERYKKEDYIVTEQSWSKVNHNDSALTIKTSDRGESMPDPARDLNIDFAKVSTYGSRITGRVTFHDGQEVKLLIDYLNDKFDSKGHRRDPKARTFEISDSDALIEDRRALIDECNRLRLKRDELLEALQNVVDATEDKGGQFRAWHNHLKQTTNFAKSAIANAKIVNNG